MKNQNGSRLVSKGSHKRITEKQVAKGKGGGYAQHHNPKSRIHGEGDNGQTGFRSAIRIRFMQTRPLESDDAEQYREIWLQGLKECPSTLFSSYEEECSVALEQITHRLSASPNRVIFGAFSGAKIIAIAGLQREERKKLSHKALLWGVYVVPRARNLKIGDHLCAHALKYAKTTFKINQVNLVVTATNQPAIKLYQNLGFVEFGIERHYLFVDGAYHDAIHMTCFV